jgi:hypothetical protein
MHSTTPRLAACALSTLLLAGCPGTPIGAPAGPAGSNPTGSTDNSDGAATRPAAPAGPGASTGSSTASLIERDGLARCVFARSGKDYALGKIDGNKVTLYATYGYVTVPSEALRVALSTITPEQVTTPDQEQWALVNALFAQQLVGIWKGESLTIEGNTRPAPEDDPLYMSFRADHTFRVIKKGTKATGTWAFEPTGKLKLSPEGREPQVVGLQRQPGDILELTMSEDGQVGTMSYSRTDLTVEPKAVDEE